MQQSLLDKYIKENISFAIFKYPDSENCTLIIGEEKVLGHSYQPLDDSTAFVFSPFDICKYPIVSILPHTILSDKAEIQKYFSPTKKDESQHQQIRELQELEEDKEAYQEVFEEFYKAILSEDFSKLVLSRTAICHSNTDNFATDLFQSASHISGAFVYLCHTPSVGTWLGATPELLLQGENNAWQTVALAGTRPKNTLTDWDTKNIEEQRYVTNYICQVLEKMNYTISLQDTETVHAGGVEHLKTKIDFNKDTENSQKLSELIDMLHPTPAICGLPKQEAFEFIRNNENYDRSYYSGLVGWVNPSDETRLYVNLRCMKIENPRTFQLFAGGGLVKSSEEQQEWQETKAKMQTLLSLLK